MNIPRPKAAIVDLMAEVFRHGSRLRQYKEAELRESSPYPLASRVMNSILGIIHRSSTGNYSSGPITHLVVANDSSIPGFRKKIVDEDYKKNRIGDDNKPISKEDENYIINYIGSKEGKADIAYLISTLRTLGIPVLDAPGHEGDDVMAWAHKRLRKELGIYAPIEIYSQDKDMHPLLADNNTRQFAERSTNRESFNGGQIRENLRIRPRQYSDYLALAGDTSDNIPRLFRSEEARNLLEYFENNRTNIVDVMRLFDKSNPNAASPLWNFFANHPDRIDPEFRAYWMKFHYGISLSNANKLLKKTNYNVEEAATQFRLEPIVENLGRLEKNISLSKLYANIDYLDKQYSGTSFAKAAEFRLPSTRDQIKQAREILQPLSDNIADTYFNMNNEGLFPKAETDDKDKFKYIPPIANLAEGMTAGLISDQNLSESDYRNRFEEAHDAQAILLNSMVDRPGRNYPLIRPFYIGGKYKQYLPIVRIHNPKSPEGDASRTFFDVVSTEGGLFARPSGSSSWHHALGYTPEDGLIIHREAKSSDPASMYAQRFPRISNIASWLNEHLGNIGQKSNGFYEFTRGGPEESDFLSHLGNNVPAQIGSPTPDMLWRTFAESEQQQRGIALGRSFSLPNNFMPEQTAAYAAGHFMALGPYAGTDPKFHAGIWPEPGEHSGFWQSSIDGPWRNARKVDEILSGTLPPAARSPIETTLDAYGTKLFDPQSSYNGSHMVLIVPATEQESLEYAKNGIPQDKIPNYKKENTGSRLMRMEEFREQMARKMDEAGNPVTTYGEQLFQHPSLRSASGETPTHWVIAHIPRDQAVMRQRLKGISVNNNFAVKPIDSSHIVAQIPITIAPKIVHPKDAPEPSKMTTYDAS